MNLQEIIENDRQWLRENRISHAKLKLRQAKAAHDEPQIKLWQAVLEANK